MMRSHPFQSYLMKQFQTLHNRKEKRASLPDLNKTSVLTYHVLEQYPGENSKPYYQTILVALYDYTARSEDELTFRKGDRMIWLDDDENWFQAEHMITKQRGFIPSNYVVRESSIGQFEWFKKIHRADAERFIGSKANADGVFLVRESDSAPGALSLSIKFSEPAKERNVRHYRIRTTDSGTYYIDTVKTFQTLEQLVNHYKKDADGLCCKLTTACPIMAPLIPVDIREKNWEISRSSLSFGELLGAGNFGEVWKGKYNDVQDVAIKMLKPGTMTPQAFLTEAEIMKKFAHEKLVRLFAVCTKEEPMYIITEYMQNGSLLNYLNNQGKQVSEAVLIDFCSQVSSGMTYLESKHYIHRDLAARNVLVGENNIVKVADFGMARLIQDGEYSPKNPGAKCPIKWTAPEAALYGKFTTKSDVWSFGVLLVEVFTRGQQPYPGMNNQEVLDQLERGYRHPKPKDCDGRLYELMLRCWNSKPLERPTFAFLHSFLDNFTLFVDAK